MLVAALLLVYLLGALTECALSPPDPADWAPAALFRRFMLGLLCAGWVGVGLAELGHFSVQALIVFLITACGLLAAWSLRPRAGSRDRLNPIPHGPWGDLREVAAIAVLLAMAAALFARPGEDVLGARDPGIYFATGAAIARDGGILQDDWALGALAADLGDASVNYWLFQSVHGWPLRFPGQLFVRDLQQGTVEPGFLPWYPVAIALALDAAVPAAGMWVNPLLSVGAILALYLTGRALFGALVAWLGAALVMLDLAEVWFARYTMAEPAAQLFVWVGIYALVALARRPTLALGALAGLAWATTLLVRIDSVLLVPPVAVYLIWRTRLPAERPPALLAQGLIALGAGHLLLHAWRFAPGYTTMVFSGATLAVAAGGIAAALAATGFVWLMLPARAASAAASQRRAVLLIVLIGLIAVLAYTLRPALGVPGADDERAALDVAARESLLRLGWYVTPLGLVLALLGAGRLMLTGGWQRAAPLLGLLALSLAFYLPNPLVSSDQPWAARRYLPVILPGLLLLAAYGAATVADWAVCAARRWRRRTATSRGVNTNSSPRMAASRAATIVQSWGKLGPSMLAILVCAPLALGQWHATAPVAGYREDAGTLAQIEALAELIPADAIVLFPRSPAGMRLSLPLQYLGRRASFVLPAVEPVEGVLQVVGRWCAEGRPVYWVVPLGTRFPTPRGFRFAPAGQFAFATEQLERPLDRLPVSAEPLRFDLQLYRIEVAPSSDDS